MIQGFKERQLVLDQLSYIPFSVTNQGYIQVALWNTSSDMATLFQAKPYGGFIKIKSNLGRKKLHRTNQVFNFVGSSFSNGDNVTAPIQFRRERHLRILKYDFSSRTDPSIFISLVPKFFHH